MMDIDNAHGPSGPIQFQRIFEAIAVPCLILAPDLTIVAVNNAYLKVTSTRREDIFGRNLFEVFPDNPAEPTASGVGNLSASLARVRKARGPDTMPIQKYDIPRPASTGGGFEERYWSPVNLPVLDEQGEILYIVHRVEDVTDFMRRQRNASKSVFETGSRAVELELELFQRSKELFELNERLRQANRKLAQLDQAKTEFFQNVSHEFRTPLSLLLGPLEELLHTRAPWDDAQRSALSIAHRNALRLLKLVNALLESAKIEVGRVKASYQPTDLSALTIELASSFRSAGHRTRRVAPDRRLPAAAGSRLRRFGNVGRDRAEPDLECIQIHAAWRDRGDTQSA